MGTETIQDFQKRRKPTVWKKPKREDNCQVITMRGSYSIYRGKEHIYFCVGDSTASLPPATGAFGRRLAGVGGTERLFVRSRLVRERDVGESVMEVDLLDAGGDVEVFLELWERSSGQRKEREIQKNPTRTETWPSLSASTSRRTFWTVCSSTWSKPIFFMVLRKSSAAIWPSWSAAKVAKGISKEEQPEGAQGKNAPSILAKRLRRVLSSSGEKTVRARSTG